MINKSYCTRKKKSQGKRKKGDSLKKKRFLMGKRKEKRGGVEMVKMARAYVSLLFTRVLAGHVTLMQITGKRLPEA